MLSKTPTWLVFTVFVLSTIFGEVIYVASSIGLLFLLWWVFEFSRMNRQRFASKSWHVLCAVVAVAAAAIVVLMVVSIMVQVGSSQETIDRTQSFHFSVLVALAGILYSMWAAASALAVAESRPAFPLFLSFFFFPIGVWWLHPRLREL